MLHNTNIFFSLNMHVRHMSRMILKYEYRHKNLNTGRFKQLKTVINTISLMHLLMFSFKLNFYATILCCLYTKHINYILYTIYLYTKHILNIVL